ncbi:MAG: Uma2 family endonuclease [Acidobacteria bacterium]|nr:Uma2 family endonuclease [Acidobacteriota bacterium]
MSAQPVRKISRLLKAIEHLPEGGTLTLNDVSREDYARLLADLDDSNRVRVSYDHGRLEIMSPSPIHEMFKELILRIADAYSLITGCELETLGSTTFNPDTLDQGAEPDTCFYVRNAARIIGKLKIDLSVDPPPDVAVEIDISSDSTNKLAIYQSLGVPEVWIYNGRRMGVYHLTDQGYVEAPNSLAFSLLTADALTEALEKSKTIGQNAALRSFRNWLRINLPPNN